MNRNLGQEVAYRLLAWKCASHQSNLVVLVALAGRLVNDAMAADELRAKFLTQVYLEEYTALLRQFVVKEFRLHDIGSPATLEHQTRAKTLVAMYRRRLLADELVALRKRDPSKMEHVAPEGDDERSLRKHMFDTLLRLVLVVEERRW